MKYSLITLLALATMALGVMGLGSSDPRELISLSNENSAFAVPSIRINGVSNLLQILNSATAYTNSTFDIITIDSFSQVTTDQGVVIQGKVTLTNDQKESVTGLITGVWDAINNKILLNATQYEETGESDESDSEGETTTDSSNPTVDEDGYTPLEINPTEVDTPVSAAFIWGVKALIETGERQNKIPISDYSVTEWTSAAYKNLTNGISYKFVAELLGANYVHVETNMTVVYSDSDQSYQLNGYYYRATNISEGSLPNNFTDVDNSTNSTDVNNNSTDINNNSTDVNNSTDINNGTNSTNNTISTPAVPDGYTYISSVDLVNNSLAQSALSWGVDNLIQKIIGQYKLPAASPVYNVTNLILAAYKNTSTGANYIYQTNLTNALKYKVDANFTVAYRDSNQTFKLNGYAFRSYNYPSGAIVIPPNNTNATNSTNNATNSTNGSSNSTNNSTGNATVPDNSTDVNNSTGNATQPGNNSTTNSTNNIPNPANNSTTNSTGNATQPTNSTNSTNPVNNTTPSNQTTADGYTIMNSTQLANDAIAQVALQNGTQTLIKTGINQYKIPSANANYTINNVTFAGYKKGNIGTSYKFSVNMTNVDYVHVDANITVFYRYSTHVYSLNGWSFRSYNYTTDPSNNNSTTPPDMDPPIYDDGSGDGIPIIIEPSDGGSGAR